MCEPSWSGVIREGEERGGTCAFVRIFPDFGQQLCPADPKNNNTKAPRRVKRTLFLAFLQWTGRTLHPTWLI